MLYVTVHLYGRNGIRGEFMEYERKALDIFRKHGGEVVVAYIPAPSGGSADVPDEIQVLRIGSRPAFEGFVSDPARAAMADERNAVIKRTEVFLSGELVAYNPIPRE